MMASQAPHEKDTVGNWLLPWWCFISHASDTLQNDMLSINACPSLRLHYDLSWAFEIYTARAFDIPKKLPKDCNTKTCIHLLYSDTQLVVTFIGPGFQNQKLKQGREIPYVYLGCVIYQLGPKDPKPKSKIKCCWAKLLNSKDRLAFPKTKQALQCFFLLVGHLLSSTCLPRKVNFQAKLPMIKTVHLTNSGSW